MRDYETMFVLRPDLDVDETKNTIEKVKGFIEKSGSIESLEEWGKKRLAYTINKKYTEGYYVLIYFKATNDVLEELEHYFKITESFIRHMIIKKEQ